VDDLGLHAKGPRRGRLDQRRSHRERDWRGGARRAAGPRGTTHRLYRPSSGSMDEGWTEWLLDQYEFRYKVISNDDVREGNLGSRFDVINDRLRGGPARSFMAPPQARYRPGTKADWAETGVARARCVHPWRGTLVCLNQSANFAIEAFHLPVKECRRWAARKDYFSRDRFLEIITDAAHPVMLECPSERTSSGTEPGIYDARRISGTSDRQVRRPKDPPNFRVPPRREYIQGMRPRSQ